MAIYGYCRVSTPRQAEDGESLAVQRRVLDGYAMMNGFALDRVFIERGVSGAKPLSERPQGAKMLDRVRRGDAIMTPRLDRAFRSALDALTCLRDLQRRGISLHMIDLGGDVTADGASRMVFTILSAVAEAERDRISEHVSTVKSDQRRRGRYLGGDRPFGWKVGKGGALAAVKREQDAIADMIALHKGGASLRAIAEDMKGRGFTVSHMAVRRILADQAGQGS